MRVFKNDGGKGKRYATLMVQSLSQICEDATRMLSTSFACKRVFTMQGKEFLPFYTMNAADSPGGKGTGNDVEDVVDGQSLVITEGEDFKQRSGYASDGITKARPSPQKKAAKAKAAGDVSENFMPFMRSESYRKGELILDNEAFTKKRFLEKLEKAPETEDPIIDRVINAMKDYYTLEEKMGELKAAGQGVK